MKTPSPPTGARTVHGLRNAGGSADLTAVKANVAPPEAGPFFSYYPSPTGRNEAAKAMAGKPVLLIATRIPEYSARDFGKRRCTNGFPG